MVPADGKGVTRKGYVRLLEERVALLEAKARQQGITISSDQDVIERHQNGQPEPDPNAPSSSSTSSAAAAGAWPLQGGNMNINSLSLSAMAEPRSRAGEFLKELAMPRIIAGITETYGGNPETTSRLDSLWDGIARDIRHPDNADGHRLRLDRDEALRSLDTYLETVDFRFPKLQAAKVQSGIDAVTAADNETYAATLATSPSHIFMAYMITAIVPLVSDGYPISHGSFVSIHVMAKCLRVLDRVFRQEDGVDIIQCLHLLVVFAIHSSAAGSSWHLIGFAIDKCIALGYHRESSAVAGESDDEVQQRRWAFWSCYYLYALLSAALDRPMSIDDRSVTVSLPDEHEGSPGPVRVLSDMERRHVHLFHYARLLSSILQEAEGGEFRYHLSRLLHWRASTPSRSIPGFEKAQAHETSLFNTLMLRAAIQQIVISTDVHFDSVLSPIGYLRPRRDEICQMRLLEICQAVVQSLDRHTQIGRPYLSVTTGYSAFSVGLAVLYYSSCMVGESVDCVNATRGLVKSARRKLDVVSRQFPRMQDYSRLVELLHRRLLQYAMGRFDRDEDLERESGELVRGIGPGHLKRLARAIITCLDISRQSF